MTKKLPRGYRNFNPGNVDRTSERWLGMADDQSSDPRFIVFVSPEYGIRCIMRLLVTYHERHGLDTIRGIIERWAPTNGRNPTTGVAYTQNTSGYVNHVSSITGWHPDEQLDLFNRDTNLVLTKAIIRHELGDPRPFGQPAEWYDEATYVRAVALAGFTADHKPLTQSRTIAGSVLAGAGAVAGAVYESLGETVTGATQAAASLKFLPENWVQYMFLLIVLLGVGRAIYARIDDEKKRVT